MLETVTDPNRINIGNLNFDEPQRQFETFNPDKDISQMDQGKMWGFLKGARNLYSSDTTPFTGSTAVYLPHAFYLFCLFPERRVDLNLNEELWEKIYPGLVNLWMEVDRNQDFYLSSNEMQAYQDALSTTAFVLTLYPKKRKETFEIYSRFQNSVWKHLRGGWEIDNDLINSYVSAAILFPKEIQPLLQDQALRANWKKMLDKSAPERIEPDLLNYFVAFKLLFPYDKIEIASSSWRKLRESYNSRANSPYQDTEAVTRYAFYLEVLAATESGITDAGDIKIIMPESKVRLSQEIPALPETRKF